MGFDLRPCGIETVRILCEAFHGYGSANSMATYAFAVYENERAVAAYSWQPPPPGAAKDVCPEAPSGVLALSRMVAVPKSERRLKHISKPLMVQMKSLIDRTRWPVLITYSDEGQGHNGYVYSCSGWEKTRRDKRTFYVDKNGARASLYSNGKTGLRLELIKGGTTFLQRWEHWICFRGQAADWMSANGWRQVAVQGRRWRSGNQAYTWERLHGGPLDFCLEQRRLIMGEGDVLARIARIQEARARLHRQTTRTR